MNETLPQKYRSPSTYSSQTQARTWYVAAIESKASVGRSRTVVKGVFGRLGKFETYVVEEVDAILGALLAGASP